jgi:hypothetical protein
VPDRRPPEPRLDRDVQFSVYRPQSVRPARWYPLLVFAHRTLPFTDDDGEQVDPLAAVAQQAAAVLGPQASRFARTAADSALALPEGAELVFEPWVERGEVNPARSVVRWLEPVHRADFRLRVQQSGRLAGGVRVFLGVLLIAEVRFVLDAATAADDSAAVRTPPVRRYRRIFPSYSRRDGEIVRRVRAAAAALGDTYLLDVDTLRSGERWQPRLAEMIAEADVFQLFWSHNSMRSPHVRTEWEHALGLGREGFVRPVFWEHPRPADPARGLPPGELDRLHFHQLEPATPATGSPWAHHPDPEPGWADRGPADRPWSDAPYGQPWPGGPPTGGWEPRGEPVRPPVPGGPAAPRRAPRGRVLLVAALVVLVLVVALGILVGGLR